MGRALRRDHEPLAAGEGGRRSRRHHPPHLRLVRGPVSAEVVADDVPAMVAEGRALARADEHVVVKVPFSPAGLAATRRSPPTASRST